MSPRLPTLTPREVIAALQRDGWETHHIRGSHHQFKHPLKSGKVTVAVHPGDVPRPILYRILEQAGLSQEEFRRLL